jgi:spore cortex biosynthesis protein YabQ
MNQEITIEVQFFLISILWGSLILLFYDVLRVIRRLIKHGAIILAFEDLIFWIAASLFIFTMIYEQNNGIIRGFSVLGMTIGLILYHFVFKDYLVNFITKCVRTLLFPFAVAVKAVRSFLKLLFSKGKMAVKFLIRQLKKILKSVKIAVNKRKQSMAAKRQKRLEKKAALRKPAKKVSSRKRNKKNPKDRGIEEDSQPARSSGEVMKKEQRIRLDTEHKLVPAHNHKPGIRLEPVKKP